MFEEYPQLQHSQPQTYTEILTEVPDMIRALIFLKSTLKGSVQGISSPPTTSQNI